MRVRGAVFVSFKQTEMFPRTVTRVIDKVSTSPVYPHERRRRIAEIAAISCTHVARRRYYGEHSVETEPSIRRLKRDEAVSARARRGESRKLIPANSQNG